MLASQALKEWDQFVLDRVERIKYGRMINAYVLLNMLGIMEIVEFVQLDQSPTKIKVLVSVNQTLPYIHLIKIYVSNVPQVLN